MLTAAIASADTNSSSHLRACLQQSGLVTSITEWNIGGGKLHDAAEAIPDVVLLDISRDPEPYFALAARLHRARPSVRLILCSPVAQPSQQLLIEAMRCGVQDFVAKPVEPGLLQETLTRISQESHPADAQRPEKLVAVMGAKGGVGTTTVAVNLGIQLAQLSKKRVVLLDFAWPLGFVPLHLGLHPRFGVRDAVENLDRLDSHFFSGLLTRHKCQLEVLAGTSQAEEWQRIPVPSLERVINVAEGSHDVVLADLGSQFSSEWRSILRLSRMVLLVAETNVPALWALERCLLGLAGFGLDPERVRIVINRWRRGDDETLKSVERNIKRPIFACLPNDFRRVSDAINAGAPMQRNGNNSLANSFAQLAAQLAGINPDSAIKRTGFTTLFSRK